MASAAEHRGKRAASWRLVGGPARGGWRAAWALLACGGFWAGCTAIVPRTTALPARYSIVSEQLVVTSDHTIPAHHRLLEDLRLLRGDILGTLGLPGSDEPIQVYVFDDEARFQTFFRRYYPGLPARRAFFLQTDTRLLVYAWWGDRVAEDLRHEVAHGYLHSVVPTIPLWLDEGLAEYFEVPRGARGLNRAHVELLVGQMLRDGWRPNLERLETLDSVATMTQADYAEAWAWTHFLLETGPSRRGILSDYLRQLRLGGATTPLSAWLRQSGVPHEPLVVEHLARLGAEEPPAGSAPPRSTALP